MTSPDERPDVGADERRGNRDERRDGETEEMRAAEHVGSDDDQPAADDQPADHPGRRAGPIEARPVEGEHEHRGRGAGGDREGDVGEEGDVLVLGGPRDDDGQIGELTEQIGELTKRISEF